MEKRLGWVINMKKTRRIYNELGLQLRNKHPKRRVKAKLREERQEAVAYQDNPKLKIASTKTSITCLRAYLENYPSF